MKSPAQPPHPQIQIPRERNPHQIRQHQPCGRLRDAVKGNGSGENQDPQSDQPQKGEKIPSQVEEPDGPEKIKDKLYSLSLIHIWKRGSIMSEKYKLSILALTACLLTGCGAGETSALENTCLLYTSLAEYIETIESVIWRKSGNADCIWRESADVRGNHSSQEQSG